MNEKVEEPQEQPFDRAPMPDEELQKILAAHRMWVESEGKAGLRAELFRVDLEGENLAGANLQGADLLQVSLQRADLGEANLQGADLWEVNLQGAKLYEANLQGAKLPQADLREANLAVANLQGAFLARADLREANLPLTTLREANLADADLRGVTGLLGGQLAGANVSGAKLPEDIAKFEGLATVEEASKNTRRIFLAMLLGCAYSVLTIFSTTDARLLTNSASSPLPIIQTPIPIAGFYGVAPAILLAIYLYFHLYLQRLWEGLATLPAIFPDGRPLDQRAYPWLVNGLVRAHFKLLRDDRPPLSRLQTGISVLLVWWIVPATLLLFWGRYLPRHDWIVTGLHIVFLVVSIGAGIVLNRLAAGTLRGENWQPLPWKTAWKDVTTYRRSAVVLAIGATFYLLSLGAIAGVDPYRDKSTGVRTWVPRAFELIGYSPFADLGGADVSTKPTIWTGDEIALVKGAKLRYKDLRYANADSAFLVKADLRDADLQGAFLLAADLRKAVLREANLRKAALVGTNLRMADLEKAVLYRANLALAHLQGADLQEVDLQEANLLSADLRGANLMRANVRGAVLERADLTGANMWGVEGLTAPQVKAAENWKLAFYSDDLLKKLGLPSDHNEKVKKKLAEMEKEKKAKAAQ